MQNIAPIEIKARDITSNLRANQAERPHMISKYILIELVVVFLNEILLSLECPYRRSTQVGLTEATQQGTLCQALNAGAFLEGFYSRVVYLIGEVGKDWQNKDN
jgi:hypothetical protein